MKKLFPLVLLLSGCHAPLPALLDPPVVDAPVLVSDGSKGGESEPYALADSSGLLVVGWIDWSPPRPSIRVTRSTNGGVSFAPSRPISPGDGTAHGDGQADVALARTADGTIVASWLACRNDTDATKESACDVYAAESRDRAATWSRPIALVEKGHAHSERDWLYANGNDVYAMWTENFMSGSDLVVAQRTSAGTFAVRSRTPKHAALSPLTGGAGGSLETLALQRGIPLKDRSKVVLDRLRSTDGARTFETLGTVTFDRAAALLPYSMGHLAAGPDGRAWIAIPRGDGASNDFVLGYRPPAMDAFRTARSLRESATSRVGMPWIAFRGTRALAAWIEEHPDGWHLMIRELVDERTRSQTVDAGRTAWRFEEASLTENTGDYLSIAVAGSSSYVVWSDTRTGRAQIHLARVH